ncbi:MAG TPA: CpaF family protein [Actinomycetota bacterium]|nr:CpaF family protein [Actinomycetota bacterium]
MSSLHERLARARTDGALPPVLPEEPETRRPHRARPDPLADLRQKVHRSLVETLGPKLYDSQLSEEQLRTRVHDILQRTLEEEPTPLTRDERQRLVAEIADDVLGFGPIEPFLRDPTVTEIMVNAPDVIYVEREGRLYPTEGRFVDETHLRRVIDKIVGQVGRRIDESSPYVDARLPDGSRLNAVIPPLCVGGGPYLTVRKFSPDPYQADDLVTFGTMSAKLSRLLDAAVHGRLNVLVSGGTGAGKTTTLNVLSSFIPPGDRIITIEDAAELQLRQPHWLRLEYRPPNIEGRGEVTIRDLVRNALRMRPDRIVVGEVRGGETLDMLQAMNTGHDGSLTTVHANSPRDSLSRLETMVLMAGVDMPMRAIREQISSAINLIVHQARLKDGSRRVTHVTEIVGMEGDVITLQDLFLFDYRAGIDENGRFRGVIQPTGLRPTFVDRLGDQGIRLDPDLFLHEPGTIPIAMRR